MQPQIQTLCIVSHVIHYEYNGELYAYAPYAREIEMWADLFPKILIASPLKKTSPPGDTAKLARHNIHVIAQPETGGDDWRDKTLQIILLPVLIWKLCQAMRQADAIHVRCPGNLGLLGALLAPLFSNYRIAKYAGQWNDFPGEASTVKLQRKILRSSWWQAPVLVYGNWPNQPSHIIPFFTSVLTAEQMRRGAQSVKTKLNGHLEGVSLRLLYVGRLTKSKNVDVIIRAIGQLRPDETQVTLSVVGEGPEEAYLRQLVTQLRLDKQIIFRGGLEFEQVLKCYAESHALVLISETEGWPKAITEAMAFGLVCIGADRGLVPYILADGRGVVIPAGDELALAAELRHLLETPEDYLLIRQNAAVWSRQYSLEGLRTALGTIMSTHWQVPIRCTASEDGPPANAVMAS